MVTNTLKDHYRTLGVSETASEKEIKRRYWDLAKVYDPDTGTEPDAYRYKEVHEAWEVLSQRREAYDKEREAPAFGSPDRGQSFLAETGLDLAKMRADWQAFQDRPIAWQAPTPALPHDSAWRGIAGVGAIVLLIAFTALPKGGGETHPSQQAIRAKAAQVAAQKQAEVNTRIGELKFMCIAGRVCNTDPVNHPLRMFIYGIDENLRLYLQEHGYTDTWSDNAGFVHGHTLYPHEEAEKLEKEKTVGYEEYSGGSIPISPEQEEQLANEPAPSSGLIFTPLDSEGNWPQEPGPVPLGVPEGSQWEIIWTLYDSQGQVVKKLHHSLEVISCPVPESEQDSESEASEPPTTPCSEVIAEQQKRREEMEAKEPSLYYQPPPPPEFRLTS
jgi:hypothetical protein